MAQDHYSNTMTDGELVDELRSLQANRKHAKDRFLDVESDAQYEAICDEFSAVMHDIYSVRAEMLGRGLIKKGIA